MSDRKRVQLKAIGKFFDGPHATPTRIAKGPYFLNISSLNHGRLDLAQSDHVSESDFQRWTKRVTPQGGDLLFSYETRLGEAALMPDGVRACLGRRMALIRPDRAVVDPAFLLYLYLGPEFQRLIEQHTIHGATVNRIPLISMPEWEIALPELSEQRAIADVLGALDDKIAANTKLAATARELARAVVPVGGERASVLELATLHKAQVDPRTLGDESVDHYSLPAFDSRNGPELIRARNIKSSKFVVSEPCVLISKLNPRFPRVWNLARLNARRALASTEFLVLEPREISTSALWSILAQSSFGRAMESKVAGTSGSHQRVKPAEILETRVSDPRAWPAQTRGAIESLAAAATAADAENHTLAATRDALLPKIMAGGLRVRAETING